MTGHVRSTGPLRYAETGISLVLVDLAERSNRKENRSEKDLRDPISPSLSLPGVGPFRGSPSDPVFSHCRSFSDLSFRFAASSPDNGKAIPTRKALIIISTAEISN